MGTIEVQIAFSSLLKTTGDNGEVWSRQGPIIKNSGASEVRMDEGNKGWRVFSAPPCIDGPAEGYYGWGR